MKKKSLYWRRVLPISMLISFVLFFKLPSLILMVVFSIIMGFAISGIIWVLIKARRSFKSKRKVKGALFTALFIFLFLIFIVVYGHTPSHNRSFFYGFTQPPHGFFYTNIFTNECLFIYQEFTGPRIPFPWYYEEGCDAPPEEMRELIKGIEWHNESVEYCISACGNETQVDYVSFCENRIPYYGISYASCADLIGECSNIDCSVWLE